LPRRQKAKPAARNDNQFAGYSVEKFDLYCNWEMEGEWVQRGIGGGQSVFLYRERRRAGGEHPRQKIYLIGLTQKSSEWSVI
jgi:hypothetical protein